MSWWIHLEDAAGEDCEVDLFEAGGTYVLGGITRAALNVTYNYGGLLGGALGMAFSELDGKTGRWAEGRLAAAVEKLGTERDEDYWAAVPGNAGAALARLRDWAREHPEGRFEVV